MSQGNSYGQYSYPSQDGYGAQNSGYPQYSYPEVQPGPKRRRNRTFITGLVLLLISVLMAGIGTFMLYRDIMDLIDRREVVRFAQRTTVEAEAEVGVFIVGLGEGSGKSCQVAGPKGEVEVYDETPTQSATVQGVTGHFAGMFFTPSKGSYQITCEGAPQHALVSLPLQRFTMFAILISLGMLLGFVALLITLVGLVLWIASPRQETY